MISWLCLYEFAPRKTHESGQECQVKSKVCVRICIRLGAGAKINTNNEKPSLFSGIITFLSSKRNRAKVQEKITFYC
jgi:hypothetical protein